MKNYAFGAAVIGALAAGGLGLATAAQTSAAPSATTAAETIGVTGFNRVIPPACYDTLWAAIPLIVP